MLHMFSAASKEKLKAVSSHDVGVSRAAVEGVSACSDTMRVGESFMWGLTSPVAIDSGNFDKPLYLKVQSTKFGVLHFVRSC